MAGAYFFIFLFCFQGGVGWDGMELDGIGVIFIIFLEIESVNE